MRLKAWGGERLERLRIHLGRPDALLQLALLGLVSGLLAGVVIVAFRLAVEGMQSLMLPGGNAENFEQLEFWQRLILPLLGGLAIGWIFLLWGRGNQMLGVARVMERMAYHQGYLTLRGFFLQFVGASIAIFSGHSVGREGPHVFLGAASGSLLGQYLALPNNSIRTLVGCGTAAGISASFNTPLAGVIFALEVVMMEYTLSSFIPVILAAVGANAVSIMVFGNDPAFEVPLLQLGSLTQMPLLLLLGVAVGAISALFIQMLQSLTQQVQGLAFWWRTSLAGLVVGVLGIMMPEVMGIGYDTVNAALLGQFGIGLLLALVVFKLLATVMSVGMGIPGGVIGPSLFIGATLGSLVGVLAGHIFPQAGIDVGLYALLGMGGMMGASLQAPLAALTAMMELTHSPQIIMPGMLVVVIAGLTASELFHKESLFITMLKTGGKNYASNPVTQALQRIGVAGVMHKRFARSERMISSAKAEQLLSGEPEWLLVGTPPDLELMAAVDLVRYLQQRPPPAGGEIDLMEIPAQRRDVAAVHLQATLQEALEVLDREGAEALYVQRMTAPGIYRIYGILTREGVESAYRF